MFFVKSMFCLARFESITVSWLVNWFIHPINQTTLAEKRKVDLYTGKLQRARHFRKHQCAVFANMKDKSAKLAAITILNVHM